MVGKTPYQRAVQGSEKSTDEDGLGWDLIPSLSFYLTLDKLLNFSSFHFLDYKMGHL